MLNLNEKQSLPISNISSERGSDGRLTTESVSTLSSRLSLVQSQLHFLRLEMQKEIKLIQEEKMKVFWADDGKVHQSVNKPSPVLHSSPNLTSTELKPYPQQHRVKTTLSSPSKKHLQDIEHQCDLELVKLHNYIRNVGELKTRWKSLMIENKFRNVGPNMFSGNAQRRTKSFTEGHRVRESDPYFI